MKSKIKLVILTPGFAADEADTTCIPALQMYLINLKTAYPDIDIKVIAFHYPLRTSNYMWNGIEVFAAGGGQKGKFFLWQRILIKLVRLRKKYGIDIVHAFWLTDTAFIGSIFRVMTGIPLVMTAMGQDVKMENNYLRILRPFRTELTFISQFQSAYNPGLVKNRKFKVIPFGIDPSYYQQGHTKRNIDILGVGALNRIKNYKDFVEIVQSVARVIPDLRCRILGEGSERRGIEQFITSIGLNRTITLAGEVSYQEVIREMHSAKILLHTSLFEGQGLVITEALASGASVVCYPTGIASDMECKNLFTGTTKEELKENVITILKGTITDSTPEIIYTIEDTCNEYLILYRNLVSGK